MGTESLENRHIKELDGVRALSITMVIWFHFWQQSWLTPRISVPDFINKYLGITEINLEGFVRYGYIFVDMLILLSAVCNFFPYARSILLGEPWPDTKSFYKKRMIRIFPSYLLNIVLMFILAVVRSDYSSTGLMWKDLLTSITCTRTFFSSMMSGTKLNPVLWTVQIECIFYLLTPWMAKLFKKRPILTYISGNLLSFIAVRYYLEVDTTAASFGNNTMFSYFCCYANGMLLCCLYIILIQKGLPDRYGSLIGTVLFFVSLWLVNKIVHILTDANAQGKLKPAQIGTRIELSFVFSVMLLSLLMSAKWLRVFFSNRVFGFISKISYNLYIWHFVIAVELKTNRIPYWEGDTSPNMLGDTAWMIKYQILIIIVSLALATILTYGFEKPIAKKLSKILKV